MVCRVITYDLRGINLMQAAVYLALSWPVV